MMQFKSLLVVGIGGALGSMCRVFLGSLLPISAFNFPLSILVINILGCCLMGLCNELMMLHFTTNDTIRMFITVGLLGGFTTFSAFSLECSLLLDKNLYALAILYIVLSNLLTLGSFFIGVKLVKLGQLLS